MDKEMLDILNDLSKKPTTRLALQIMELSSENLILEQQCKKQKEAIDKVINLIVKETKSMPTNGCKIRLIEILDILNEVSE